MNEKQPTSDSNDEKNRSNISACQERAICDQQFDHLRPSDCSSNDRVRLSSAVSIWFNRIALSVSVLGHEQTSTSRTAMSAPCQKRTFGLALPNALWGYAARLTCVSISLRSAPKSIGLVKSPSAPPSNALRLVSASP